jgi:hypothetical protein
MKDKDRIVYMDERRMMMKHNAGDLAMQRESR